MAELNITSGGKEYLEPACELLSDVFKTDAAIRYMTSSLSQQQHAEYMKPYMHTLLKAASLNDAVFQEVNSWSTCAVWISPGKRVDNPLKMIQAGLVGALFKLGVGGAKRMFVDYVGRTDEAKKTHLRGIKRFYYLFFVGTASSARGKGLASAAIQKYQEKANAEKLPIWLEATSAHSRDVYVKLGFQVLEEIVLGHGTHDENGERKEGGPGLRIWPMIWKPEEAETKGTNKS